MDRTTECVGGYWEIEDIGTGIEVNGVSLKINNFKGFAAPQAFPPQAGLGLFQPGLNEIVMVVRNSATAPRNPNNPTGLRVDAALVLELDPIDNSLRARVFLPAAPTSRCGR